MPLYSTPLGSPTAGPKRSYVHVPLALPTRVPLATARAYGPGWDQGGYTGWVSGWAIPGTTQPPRKEQAHQRSGPRKALQGPGVGGWVQRVRPGSQTTHSGPLDLRGPLRCLGPFLGQYAASWPITARFDVIFHKVSQNRVVSPESVQKASHSPCFQNRLQKSPLEILRFPFSLAFSHKELMGHI